MSANRIASRENAKGSSRALNSRRAALVILVAVVVALASSGYVILSTPQTGESSPPPTCPPYSSCPPPPKVYVWVPYAAGPGQTMASVVEGLSFPAFISLDVPEFARFTLLWGDGTNSSLTVQQFNESAPPLSHVYSDLGTFVLLGAATLRNNTFVGNLTLLPLQSVAPVPLSISQVFPGLSTTFSNGSSGPLQYYPWTHVGQRVSVSAAYTSLPTFPGYVPRPPTLVASPGAILISGASSGTSVAASYSFSSPGMYWITMVGPISEPWGTIYQNYTWSIYVGATGVPLGCYFCGPFA